jgi:hypothetical protein
MLDFMLLNKIVDVSISGCKGTYNIGDDKGLVLQIKII